MHTTRSIVPSTQKLRSPWVRIRSYERLPPVKPRVGQSTALHALPTAQNSALIDAACPVNIPPLHNNKETET